MQVIKICLAMASISRLGASAHFMDNSSALFTSEEQLKNSNYAIVLYCSTDPRRKLPEQIFLNRKTRGVEFA